MFTSREASASCAFVGAPTSGPEDGADEVDAVAVGFDPLLHEAITSAAIRTTQRFADNLRRLTGNAWVGAISQVLSFSTAKNTRQHAQCSPM